MTAESTTEASDSHVRDEYPSGWLALTRNESVNYIIDGLLDAPSHREYNKSELAEKSGVNRKSVGRHIDLLLEVGIVEEVSETSPQRYRFNPENDVSKAIIQLDGAMNSAGPFHA